MKKIISALAALAVGLGLAVVAVPLAAIATHPKVSGVVVCNTQTGNYDVTWHVTGDPNYPNVSWKFVSASRPSVESQIVGQTGMGGAGFDATETVTGKQTLHLEVGIQFSNHQDGDIVTNKGKVVISENCVKADVLDAAATVTITPPTCTAPGSAQVAGLAFATLNGSLDTSVGSHVATFTAEQGHKFAGGSATLEVPYTVPGPDASLCPTNQVCTTIAAGPVSTDLSDLWAHVDTRSKGHSEYVSGGLHVWTDDNSSQAKVSEGYPVSFPLKNTGTLDLEWTGSTPPPGINLYVNFGADGTGILVYESVYGQDLWLSNGSPAAVKANAPVNGGGNGSPWHGTIDQWLTKYPDAQVTGLAYSLGSGVLGDGVITSITAGCVEYTFDKVVPPTVPEPTVEWSYTNWKDGEYECNDTQVTITREATKTTTTYKLVVVEGQYQIVVDQVIAEDPVTQTDTRQLDESERTICVVATAPTASDQCGTANDKVNLPDVEGLGYTVTWNEAKTSAVVTVTAQEGYTLVAEGDTELVTEWTFDFTNDACPLPPTTPKQELAQTGLNPDEWLIWGGIGALAILAGLVFTINHLRHRRQQ